MTSVRDRGGAVYSIGSVEWRWAPVPFARLERVLVNHQVTNGRDRSRALVDREMGRVDRAPHLLVEIIEVTERIVDETHEQLVERACSQPEAFAEDVGVGAKDDRPRLGVGQQRRVLRLEVTVRRDRCIVDHRDVSRLGLAQRPVDDDLTLQRELLEPCVAHVERGGMKPPTIDSGRHRPRCGRSGRTPPRRADPRSTFRHRADP